jgi:Zn-dependent protease
MDHYLVLLFQYIIIIFSAIIHEYAHGWAAYREGDPTAKYAGRLTLNPIAHLDLWGTVLMPLILLFGFGFFFGYAKPVPINPNNFRDQRRGLILVSFAGVAANFLIAILIGLGLRFLPNFFFSNQFNVSVSGNGIFNPWIWIVIINIWLGLFNLLPVPPLDGSKLLFGFLAGRSGKAVEYLRGAGSWFGIIFALFVAFTFLPYLASFIFTLITGGNIGI